MTWVLLWKRLWSRTKVTKSNVWNDGCKDNETRKREFWYRVSVRYSCSGKSENFYRFISHHISIEIRVRYLASISRYTISTRSMITHIQYENRNTFTYLLITDSFCSSTFSLVPFVRSLLLTYVQWISHKNAGWSIIRAIHSGTLEFAIKLGFWCA